MFTVEQLRAKVIELGNRYPDRVYKKPETAENCSYLDSADCPGSGCIFGCAIMELNPELKPILEKASAGRGWQIGVLLEELGFERKFSFLTVQTTQDTGKCWSDAIKLLDRN